MTGGYPRASSSGNVIRVARADNRKLIPAPGARPARATKRMSRPLSCSVAEERCDHGFRRAGPSPVPRPFNFALRRRAGRRPALGRGGTPGRPPQPRAGPLAAAQRGVAWRDARHLDLERRAWAELLDGGAGISGRPGLGGGLYRPRRAPTEMTTLPLALPTGSKKSRRPARRGPPAHRRRRWRLSKWPVLPWAGGAQIETVLILATGAGSPSASRPQAGCRMNCQFCAPARPAFTATSTGEILEQVDGRP